MEKRRPRTVVRAYPAAVHLAILASIIALPLLLLLGLLLYRSADGERRQLEQRLVSAAANLAAELDRDIDRQITILQTLISSRSLAAENFVGFHERASLSLRGKGHVILIDADGRQIVNTYVPYGAAPPLTGNWEMLQSIRRTHQPAISNLFTGLVTRDVVFNISVPILDGNTLQYVLSLSLRPAVVQSLLDGQALPPPWTMTVWDGNGLVVARSRDHERLVGTALPPRLRGQQEALRSYRTKDIDGTEVLHAFAPSRFSGWGVGVSVPESLILNQIRQSVLIWGGTIVAVALLVLGLAVVFGRRITQPLAVATAAARALGREETFEVRPSAVSEINRVNQALGSARDELAARSAALRRSEEQLRSAADAAQFGAHEYEVATDRVIRSPQLIRILGADATDPSPNLASGLAFVHPDDRESVRRRKQLILDTSQGSYQLEYRIRRPDGAVRWVMDRGQVARDPRSGHAVRVVGVLLDITDLKEAEQRQKLLFDELNHRVKNTLAIVQSLARQTLRTRPDPEDFAKVFEDRIASLARAHDLLTREAWAGALLADIVEAALAPFADDGRVTSVAGDDVLIPASATITLSLMLHELAANAAKYGALAVADGHLFIDWEVVRTPGAVKVRVDWRERGGPFVVAPSRTGFGSRLLAASVRQLDGQLDVNYAPGGLHCSLRFAVPA